MWLEQIVGRGSIVVSKGLHHVESMHVTVCKKMFVLLSFVGFAPFQPFCAVPLDIWCFSIPKRCYRHLAFPERIQKCSSSTPGVWAFKNWSFSRRVWKKMHSLRKALEAEEPKLLMTRSWEQSQVLSLPGHNDLPNELCLRPSKTFLFLRNVFK